NIEIVVHPQSIIHSMVEFKDGSIKAQLSSPNMRLPIQFALSFPERYTLKDLNFNISEFSNLTFKKVDVEKFTCVKLAIEAIRLGGSYPTVLNVSNDLCVDFFLNDLITFNQIPDLIEKSLDKHEYINNPDLSEIKRITHSVKNNLKEFIRK
ncbi:MAG: 1-deoxy-D-xylulose-5-phosphate reductoisomerase, partial [Candidatus Marinimicrobia bacterium]|nr:1-deoxy-D-xylulose-5-phosphate reductoisomerase [Candidatus Neomarinimicrobiota bacterium]